MLSFAAWNHLSMPTSTPPPPPPTIFAHGYWKFCQIFIEGHPSHSCVASESVQVIREYKRWLKWCTTIVIWTDDLICQGPLGRFGRFCGQTNGDSDQIGWGGSSFFGVGCNLFTVRSMLWTISYISTHILDVNCIILILSSCRCCAWAIISLINN